jgi:hypothetical protein
MELTLPSSDVHIMLHSNGKALAFLIDIPGSHACTVESLIGRPGSICRSTVRFMKSYAQLL